MQEDANEQSYKMKYYNLKDAVNDVAHSVGGKEKSVASAKLFGKTLFNTTLFSGRAIIKTGKEILEQKEKYQDASEEELLKLKESGRFVEKSAASSILKERENRG